MREASTVKQDETVKERKQRLSQSQKRHTELDKLVKKLYRPYNYWKEDGDGIYIKTMKYMNQTIRMLVLFGVNIIIDHLFWFRACVMDQ